MATILHKTLLLILVGGGLFAQQGIGTNRPNPQAALDITSSDKGILIPRISLTASNTFLGGVTATVSHTSMLVYNSSTATNTGLTGVGYYFWNSTNWRKLGEDDTVPLWKSLTNGGSYVTNDLINYNGALYKNLTGTNSNTTPDLDETNWERITGLPEYESGEVIITPEYNPISAGAGVWQSIETFQIPSAGKWRITGIVASDVLASVVVTAGFRTGGVVVPNSEFQIGYAIASNRQSGVGIIEVETTGATTYELVVKRHAEVDANIYSGEFYGFSKVRWEKVAGFLPVTLDVSSTAVAGTGIIINGNTISNEVASVNTVDMWHSGSVAMAGSFGTTILPFNQTIKNTDNWFNTTTNRFTPQKAGYWNISVGYRVYSGSSADESYIYIRKNGVRVGSNGGFGCVNSSISKSIFFNGTTDYIDIRSSLETANTNPQTQSIAYFTATYVGN